MRIDLDPFSELAKVSAERARELITARLTAIDFGPGDVVEGGELVALWSPTVVNIVTEILGDEATGLDERVVERIAYQVAALSYLGAAALAQTVDEVMPDASPEVKKQKVTAYWQDTSRQLVAQKQEGPHF